MKTTMLWMFMLLAAPLAAQPLPHLAVEDASGEAAGGEEKVKEKTDKKAPVVKAAHGKRKSSRIAAFAQKKQPVKKNRRKSGGN